MLRLFKKNKINFNTSINDEGSLYKKNKVDLYKILDFALKDSNIYDKCVISLNIFDSKKVRELNNIYREKDVTTDVLSFPQRETFNNIHDLGDIIINGSVLNKKAISIGSNIDMELKFLFMHGLLHILGHTHNTDEAYENMVKKEREIFRILNIRDNDKLV